MNLTPDGLQLYLIIASITALAGTLQSVVGFGFNLVAAPLLIFFLKDPKEVVPALHLSWFLLGLAICLRLWHQMNARRIVLWFMSALPAVFIGVWVLSQLDESNEHFLNRAIGSVTILATIAIALKFHRPFRHEKPWILASGGLSGLLCGSTGMSGPPLVLLGLNQGWPAAQFRADLLGYFTLLSIATIGICQWQGLITETSIRYAVAGTPGLAIGFIAGALIAKHIHGDRFRYVAICLICATGVLPWLV